MRGVLPLVVLCCLCAVVAVSGAGSAAAPAPCTYTSGSNNFDLSSLYKPTGTYKGTDGTYEYQMNVCGPVNNAYTCSDRGYAACQFSQAGGSFIASLGSFVTPPVWSLITLSPNPPEPAANGVMYTFTNGDMCWIVGRMQARTVQVVFRCVASGGGETFTIAEDQTTCTFTLTLKTNVSCANGGGTAITSANYTDTQTRSKWDLSPLDSTLRDYVTESGAYNYSMNICDLTTRAGQCRDEGHSICQYNFRGDFFAGLGGIRRTPPGIWSLITSDPSVGIRQIYKNGEPCFISGQEVPRTSIVSFYCNPTGPRTFTIAEDTTTCTYNFKFQVAEGCPSRA